MAEFIAISKSVRMNPRKVRLVADSIRNLSAAKAVVMLSLMPKRAALPIEKTIRSAVANAVSTANVKSELLVIKRIEVSEGQALKRFRPSTRGRVHPYKHRTSHISVVVGEK